MILVLALNLTGVLSGGVLDLDPQLVGTWPTGGRGSAEAVAVAGNRAYVLTSEGWLQVVDVSNAARPTWVSSHNTDGWPYGLPVSTNFVYLPDPDEVWLVNDVSEPANPRRVGGYRTIASAMGARIVGTHAYVAAGEVIDISDPAHPRPVEGVPGFFGCWDVTPDSQYAVVARDVCSLYVIDISDPLNPRVVGWTQNEEGPCCPQALAVEGHYAYVTTCHGYVEVIDFGDPANPHWAGSYDLWGSRAVTVASNLAHVVSEAYGLVVFDVSLPEKPRRVGAFNTFPPPVDVAVSGHYAYLADAEAGLLVVDISRLANPQQIGNYAANRTPWDRYTETVAVRGPLACVPVQWWNSVAQDSATRLEVVDVANPASPVHLGSCQMRGEANHVVISGHYVYVARAWLDQQTQKWQGALEVIDLGTPTRPAPVGTLQGLSRALAVWDNHVYAAGEGWDAQGQTWQRALEIIDVSDPADPRQVGHLPGVSGGLALFGSRAYVCGGKNDGTNWIGVLSLVDISDPTNPRLMEQYETSEWRYGLPIATNLTCVADPEGGWQVVDVSNPDEPKRVGPYRTIAAAFGIDISGNYAYTGGPAGLQVIDVSDPRTPRRVGGNSAFEPWDIVIEGNRVYVAIGEQGMAILGLYEPPLWLEAPHLDHDGFRMLLRGVTGQMISVERSRNLRTWEPFATVPIPASGQTLIDPAATTEPFLFYRAVSVP